MARIVAPHFVAGLVVGETSAPIIAYMRKWPLQQIEAYCHRKGWDLALVRGTSLQGRVANSQGAKAPGKSPGISSRKSPVEGFGSKNTAGQRAETAKSLRQIGCTTSLTGNAYHSITLPKQLAKNRRTGG